MKRVAHSDSTHCVHAGEDRHGRNAALTTEITQTSVFALKDTEQLRKYAAGDRSMFLYGRYGLPTVKAAEAKIAALEGAEDCVLTSSGMAAEMAIALSVCKAGDEIVSMLDIYGGTRNLFRDVLSRCGITTKFVPFGDLAKISRHFTRKTKMLFIETPTNPTLRCVNIDAVAAEAHKRGIVVVVDNTFATPILQKPLQHGAIEFRRADRLPVVARIEDPANPRGARVLECFSNCRVPEPTLSRGGGVLSGVGRFGVA